MSPKRSKASRRQRFSGGLCQKTGYYVDAATGEKKPYTYWQATREVAEQNLPRGMSRKRISGSGKTEREALARLEENWLRFHQGDYTPRTKVRGLPKLTVSDLYDRWQEHNEGGAVSEMMAYKYEGYFRNHILPHIGRIRLEHLSERDLLLLFEQTLPAKVRSDGRPLLSGAARRNIYMALSGALSFAVRHGHLNRSPLSGVRAPLRRRPADDIDAVIGEIGTLLTALNRQDNPDRARWLLQFLGLRRAERLGLAWSDINGLNTGKATMTIQQQLARLPDGRWYIKDRPKNSRSRTIVVPEPFLSALRAHKAEQDRWKRRREWKPKKEFENLVFLQEDGAIYTLNRDNKDWHKLLEELGIPYYRAHLNRHITATLLAEQTDPPVPIGTVREILGHSSEAMTFYYARTRVLQQQAPMERYGEAIQGSLASPPKSGSRSRARGR